MRLSSRLLAVSEIRPGSWARAWNSWGRSLRLDFYTTSVECQRNPYQFLARFLHPGTLEKQLNLDLLSWECEETRRLKYPERSELAGIFDSLLRSLRTPSR